MRPVASFYYGDNQPGPLPDAGKQAERILQDLCQGGDPLEYSQTSNCDSVGICSPVAEGLLERGRWMSSIFISYRRDDAEGQAGRLYDDLVAEFGAESVFMDVADIQPGRDFRKVIEQSLSSCGAFLSVIGKGWVTAKDESGKRRLDDPADFVRVETATALRRDIPLVPVLVQGATTPKPDQLPDELKDLAYRNAMEITHARWDSDVQLLIKALRSYFPVTPKPVNGQSASADGGRRKWSAKQVGLVTAVLVAVIGMVLYLGQPRKAEVGTNLADSNANAPPEAASDEKLAAPNSKEKPGAANARMSKLPFDPGAVLATTAKPVGGGEAASAERRQRKCALLLHAVG